MGLELRKVPMNWQHPKNLDDGYIPLKAEYGKDMKEWKAEGSPKGLQPQTDGYMPDWPEKDRTHFQMYENVSEGTPVSPVMASTRELAQWLAQNLRKSGWTQYQFPAATWLEILTSNNPIVYLVVTKTK